MSTSDPNDARRAVLALLGRRAPGATLCPSEAARLLAPNDWRGAMAAVHGVADMLLAEGTIVLSWKGKVLPRRAGVFTGAGAS